MPAWIHYVDSLENDVARLQPTFRYLQMQKYIVEVMNLR